METYLADAAERNFQRWPVLGTYVWPNNFIGDTYAEEMGYLRDWTTERLEWMDDNMFGSCEDLSLIDESAQQVKVYPNPTAGESQLTFKKTIINGQIIIKTITGEALSTIALNNTNQYMLDLSAYAPALYIIQIYDNESLISNLKIIRQ